MQPSFCFHVGTLQYSIMNKTVYEPVVTIYDAGEVVQSDAEFPGPVHWEWRVSVAAVVTAVPPMLQLLLGSHSQDVATGYHESLLTMLTPEIIHVVIYNNETPSAKSLVSSFVLMWTSIWNFHIAKLWQWCIKRLRLPCKCNIFTCLREETCCEWESAASCAAEVRFRTFCRSSSTTLLQSPLQDDSPTILCIVHHITILSFSLQFIKSILIRRTFLVK